MRVKPVTPVSSSLWYVTVHASNVLPVEQPVVVHKIISIVAVSKNSSSISCQATALKFYANENFGLRVEVLISTCKSKNSCLTF